MNERIHDLRIELIATRTLRGGDRFERLLERHCRVYLPYLFTSARHDRTRLEREFGATGAFAGPDDADLRRIFTNHLDVWRAERRTRPLPRECPEARCIGEYFGAFLGRRTGQRLVPGLESLTADFTVSVPSVGIYRLTIESGVLTSVSPADRPSAEIDYRGDAPSVLLAVEGRVRPSELFFQKRVTIAGDLPRALSTAVALEEFFRLHPFVASKSA